MKDVGWALGPGREDGPLPQFPGGVVIKEAVASDKQGNRYYPNNATISNIRSPQLNVTSVSVTEATLASGGSLKIVREVMPISLGVIY